MANKEHIPIVRHMNLDDLEAAIDEADVSTAEGRKLAERLRFIRLRYMGYETVEACRIAGVNTQTGYNWQKLWNEGGFDALMPNYGGGRPSSMTEEQRTQLYEAVKANPMTTTEVGDYIKREFKLTFTPKHVRSILRGWGLRHAKPYDIDYRRPQDAEAVLKKTSEQPWIP